MSVGKNTLSIIRHVKHQQRCHAILLKLLCTKEQREYKDTTLMNENNIIIVKKRKIKAFICLVENKVELFFFLKSSLIYCWLLHAHSNLSNN